MHAEVAVLAGSSFGTRGGAGLETSCFTPTGGAKAASLQTLAIPRESVVKLRLKLGDGVETLTADCMRHCKVCHAGNNSHTRAPFADVERSQVQAIRGNLRGCARGGRRARLGCNGLSPL